jgi:hypothetical protein
MKTTKNLGVAGIVVTLFDNKIKVYHKYDNILLFEKEATEQCWDNIWEAIRKSN